MKIVFYDGSCGLCQRSVSFLLHLDNKKEFLFAPLNGITYKKTFGDTHSDLSTVILYNEDKIFIKSAALLEVCRILGGQYYFFYIFKIIPVFVRDFLYDLIANRRKNIRCVVLQKDDRFLN